MPHGRATSTGAPVDGRGTGFAALDPVKRKVVAGDEHAEAMHGARRRGRCGMVFSEVRHRIAGDLRGPGQACRVLPRHGRGATISGVHRSGWMQQVCPPCVTAIHTLPISNFGKTVIRI